MDLCARVCYARVRQSMDLDEIDYNDLYDENGIQCKKITDSFKKK